MKKINNVIHPITKEKILRFFDEKIANEISSNGKIAIRKLLNKNI
jgi:hypothetical protein